MNVTSSRRVVLQLPKLPTDVPIYVINVGIDDHVGPTTAAAGLFQRSRHDPTLSTCKVFTANVTQDAIDLAVQCCGANGIGKDLPLSDFYESVRQFRIVDGADEVHRRVIARHAFDDLDDAELELVTRFGDPKGRNR